MRAVLRRRTGTQEKYVASGSVLAPGWLTSKSERTRPEVAQYHGYARIQRQRGHRTEASFKLDGNGIRELAVID